MQPEILKRVFPRWLSEFRRAQRLKSALFLCGNVYDSYFLPENFTSATSEADLRWARHPDVRQLLDTYLRADGFELVVSFDPVDGLEASGPATNGTPAISRENLVAFLRQASTLGAVLPDLEPAARTLAPERAALLLRAVMENSQRPAACVVNFASRLTSNPKALTDREREVFLHLLKGAQGARTFADGRRSLLVILCDGLQDVPPWLLLDNPLTRGIELQRPDKDERARFFQVQGHRFHPKVEAGVERAPGIREQFVDLTDGLTNRELEGLLVLSQREPVAIDQVRQLVDLYKFGERISQWKRLDRARIAGAEQELGRHVRGQLPAIRKACEILRRAWLGLDKVDQSRSNRPKGVLFLAGPTGTGKTELAKALARLVFNDEEAVIRFDMTEYQDANSDVKLIGAPPGYVGYEEGGQLTSRIRARPFSVLLFDEFEKAHKRVYQKFLQILDDGRLTDGRGDTVYFGETLVIFTSNAGHEALEGKSPAEVEEGFRTGIRRHFTGEKGLPELYNRLGDSIVVFDFIRPPVDREIAEKEIAAVSAGLQAQLGVELRLADGFVDRFCAHYVADNLENGGRGIRNRVETHVKNQLANFLFEQGADPEKVRGRRLALDLDSRTLDDSGRPRVHIAWI